MKNKVSNQKMSSRPAVKAPTETRRERKAKAEAARIKEKQKLKGRTVVASSSFEIRNSKGEVKKVKRGDKVRFVESENASRPDSSPPKTTPQENGVTVTQALTSAAESLAEEKRKKNSLTSFNPYEETRDGQAVIDVSIHPEARSVFYVTIRFDDNHIICIER